ncbi:C1 family peptidase [Thermosipho sp. (in: thermotogales)]|uniref:C1 family peptidase n=1 Tax=Thermosipho sp. (in: thermotogales) TaxID=1968895 RepID=UPI00257A3DB0|nr:C1 family peptidase [Thermosipho sp. (in: thermotogales)]
MNIQRPLGVIPSRPDYRDYRLNQFTDIEKTFPDYYLVPPYQNEEDIPVYDQGYTSMCVAFTGASITEQQEYLETSKFRRVSPGWIYGNRTSGMYLGEGMEPREAWAQLCKDGVPEYEDLPVIGSFTECYEAVYKNKDRLLKKAQNYKKLSYVAVNWKDADEIRTAIMKCGAINVCIAVYKDFDEVGKDGFLTSSTKGSIRGYHSLTCVGFFTKNNKVYLIILNSWGKEWGKNGLCYMPYDYRGIQEVWAITDMQRRVIEANIAPLIIPPGHFVIPFRGLFEAENAEQINWWYNEKRKIEAEAILPATKRRRIHVIEGEKDIIVEYLE